MPRNRSDVGFRRVVRRCTHATEQLLLNVELDICFAVLDHIEDLMIVSEEVMSFALNCHRIPSMLPRQPK